MGKRKPIFKMDSFGEYSGWNRESNEIPKIKAFNTEIKAQIDTEFGYVLHIRNGKGEKINFEIDHPPFTGEEYIRTNDYLFYIGDCIWEPLHDKLGKWEITTWYNNQVVAHKIFHLL